MDKSADKEMLILDCTVVFVKKCLGYFRAEFRVARIYLFILLTPVVGCGVTEIKARTGVPFLATSTLPAKVGQIVERHSCVGVANARTFVASGTEQDNLC